MTKSGKLFFFPTKMTWQQQLLAISAHEITGYCTLLRNGRLDLFPSPQTGASPASSPLPPAEEEPTWQTTGHSWVALSISDGVTLLPRNS